MYGGDGATLAPSTSARARVLNPSPARVTVYLHKNKTAKVRKGTAVMVYGHIKTAAGPITGKYVRFYQRRAGTKRWSYVRRTTSLAPTGWYSTTSARAGRRSYKAVSFAAPGLPLGTSNLATVGSADPPGPRGGRRYGVGVGLGRCDGLGRVPESGSRTSWAVGSLEAVGPRSEPWSLRRRRRGRSTYRRGRARAAAAAVAARRRAGAHRRRRKVRGLAAAARGRSRRWAGGRRWRGRVAGVSGPCSFSMTGQDLLLVGASAGPGSR